ncbi:MAG: response regulator [Lachnospiraceae bacterium]|nr:response regulator [Lachnospiraceae bacterium]
MKHILMVDDVTTNLKSAAEVLQPFYHLSMAKSGRQALNFLKKNRPDLILLDIMMPEMDGYETMEQIKLNPRTANIPIIFLTADTEHESEIRGLKMGALDFITKPFEADVMLGRIEKVLQMEDMRRNLLSSGRKDPLTDLYKSEYLAAEVDSRIRFTQSDTELVMVDLDGFGRFREEQGNSNADGVIIRFTEALKRIALKDSLLGRTGADEFVIFIPVALSEAELMSFCEEICHSVMEEANAARGGGERLTASVAAVFSPLHGKDYETLYRKLQMAMYFVKQSGRNRVHFYRGL